MLLKLPIRFNFFWETFKLQLIFSKSCSTPNLLYCKKCELITLMFWICKSLVVILSILKNLAVKDFAFGLGRVISINSWWIFFNSVFSIARELSLFSTKAFSKTILLMLFLLTLNDRVIFSAYKL